MGKETKIGLAVIAVLMTVFGVLLFRHLQASHELPTRGLGDQTAVKPLPAHGDVKLASDESRITGSKLWDTPSDNAPPATVEVAVGNESDPYETNAAEAKSQVVAAGAPREIGSNPLRQASAEVPVDEPPAVDKEGDEEVVDPLMTLPATAAPASASAPVAADPYAGESTELPAEEPPLPADNTYDAPAPAPSGAATRNPFGNAPVGAAVEPAQSPAAARAEPAWTENEPPAAEPQYTEPQYAEPQYGADPQHEPVSGVEPQAAPEPSYESAPQTPANQFDRFESPATEPEPAAARATGVPAEDTWRTSAPAAAPLAADAGEAAPLPIQDGLYTVQPGDSLWSVSEAVYGTGGYFKALAAHNRAMLPQSDKLTVGSQLAVPPVEELHRDYPSLCPRPRKSAVVKAGATRASAVQPPSGRDIYIVNDGDTLFTIARYELGKATRWAEIYDLNRDALGEDFDYLRPGMELVMPARGTEAASQPAASRY